MAQREDREKAPSARSTGSDKSAPSVAQRTPGQIRKHRKRSYAGRAARCLLCCVLCTLLTRSSVYLAGMWLGRVDFCWSLDQDAMPLMPLRMQQQEGPHRYV